LSNTLWPVITWHTLDQSPFFVVRVSSTPLAHSGPEFPPETTKESRLLPSVGLISADSQEEHQMVYGHRSRDNCHFSWRGPSSSAFHLVRWTL